MRVWPILIAIPLCGSIAAHVFIDGTGEAARGADGQRPAESNPDEPTGVGRPLESSPPDLLQLGHSPIGAQLYARHCAGCHGWRAEGGPMGPEIAATVSSETVRTAILTGVAADTGAFGGMPPIAGLSTREAETILRYLKALNASSAGL